MLKSHNAFCRCRRHGELHTHTHTHTRQFEPETLANFSEIVPAKFVQRTASHRIVRAICKPFTHGIRISNGYDVLYVPQTKPLPAAVPVNPFAFIRVHNEKPTLRCSLHSILPAINRGVIAYNDCTDGSEEIILEFCRSNTGFIPAKFDFFNAYSWETQSQKLARYYNYALSFIPHNEWLIKIDTDQIYDAEKLSKAFSLPKTSKDIIHLPRMQLHYDGKELFVFDKHPFNFEPDHWIIFNDGNLFFTESSNHRCETLRVPVKRGLMQYIHLPNKMMFEISNYHFPSVKQWRKMHGVKGITPFDIWIKNWNGKLVNTRDNETYPSEFLDKKLLDKEFIMSYVRQFELS